MLSKTEIKVLLALLKNARAPLSELAKKAKLTRQTVYKTMKGLERKRVIRGYCCDLDQGKLGMEIKAYLLIQLRQQGHYEKVEKAVMWLKEVSQMHYLLGRHDLLIEVTLENRRRLTDFLRKLQGLEEIERTETLLVLETKKSEPHHPAEAQLQRLLDRKG